MLKRISNLRISQETLSLFLVLFMVSPTAFSHIDQSSSQQPEHSLQRSESIGATSSNLAKILVSSTKSSSSVPASQVLAATPMIPIDESRSADYCINKLQGKQEEIEMFVKKFAACDVKTQSVLRFIQNDQELWNEFAGKLEVRAIRITGNGEDGQKIVLHPRDEDRERWRGVYHVYATVQHKGKRLVIDTYIAGKDSCASVEERDFIKSKWKGKEGEEFLLETIVPAPYHEQFRDADGLPNYTINDFIDGFFDAENVPRHSFLVV